MSVAEWMIRIGWFVTLAYTEQDQQTIACVDYRVDRLREHRGTAGERGREKLRHRNREVPRDRCVDRKRGFRNSPISRTHLTIADKKALQLNLPISFVHAAITSFL